MLDRDGYRPNVAIVIVNSKNFVFWGKRIREHAWQFPQGGIHPGETPEQAMFRELQEEVGLAPGHVTILGRTREWMRYDVPAHWIKREWRGSYRGQKQIWYLLRLVGRDSDVSLRASDVTVKIHRARVMDKMRAVSLADLVRTADRLDRESGMRLKYNGSRPRDVAP